MGNILVGIIATALGVFFIWLAIKKPITDRPDPSAGNFSAVLAGVSFIIIGVLSLFGYFDW